MLDIINITECVRCNDCHCDVPKHKHSLDVFCESLIKCILLRLDSKQTKRDARVVCSGSTRKKLIMLLDVVKRINVIPKKRS